MERWSGKVALVTGASAGIGAAIAVDLAQRGLNVVALARRVEKVEKLKEKLTNAKGELFPLKGDVSKEEEIMEAFRWIKSKFATIHVLVNNAGIFRPGKLLDCETEHWKNVLDVNVLGLCICTREAFRLMKETGVEDGHIVHINSVAGHGVPIIPEPVFNIYPASKHAVTALTEIVRQELNFAKSKIRITSISPGVVATEIRDAGYEATTGLVCDPEVDYYADKPALLGEDVAEVVAFVLSTPPRVQIHEIIMKPVGQLT